MNAKEHIHCVTSRLFWTPNMPVVALFRTSYSSFWCRRSFFRSFPFSLSPAPVDCAYAVRLLGCDQRSMYWMHACMCVCVILLKIFREKKNKKRRHIRLGHIIVIFTYARHRRPHSQLLNVFFSPCVLRRQLHGISYAAHTNTLEKNCDRFD